jgi:hypothetical protein
MTTRKFTYHYHASAFGLGGVLKDDRDVTTIAPSLASVTLPFSGGEDSAEITNYDDGRGVSFSSAYSHVHGSDSAYRTFTTSSDIWITDLNLFGRVKAKLLQLNVVSTREVLASGVIKLEADPDKSEFTMNAIINGLTIDGVAVDVQLDDDLCGCRKYSDFVERINKTPSEYAQQFGVEETALNTLTASSLPVHASLVKDIKYKRTGKFGPRDGFMLPVKNFGYVHLAELVVQPGHRQINLLRIEFDSTLLSDSAPAEREEAANPMFFANTTFLDAETEDAPVAPDMATAMPSPARGTMTVVGEDSNGAPTWP